MKKTIEDVLAHHGILGMRWGVRRARGDDGRVTSRIESKTAKAQARTERRQAKAEGRKTSDEYKTSRALMAKSAKSLSNAEIKKLNERLRLETELKRLNPASVAKGHNFAKEILAIGTTLGTIYALSNSPLGKSIKRAVTKSGQMKMPGF